MPSISFDPLQFSKNLFSIMQEINPGISELEFYEFQYALKNLQPVEGWEKILPEPMETLLEKIARPEFFANIQLKPRNGDQVVLDETITALTRQLFVGLVEELYPADWVNQHFYFDVRSFVFLVRTIYLTAPIRQRFGGLPYRNFEAKQALLDNEFEVGYKEFAQANQEIDSAFIEVVRSWISARDTPLLLTIVGPTASGKSEITMRLLDSLKLAGLSCGAVEMDNFYKDRVYRDGRPMTSEVIHYPLFIESINALLRGEAADIPRYDFILATSSHDLDDNLRPGQSTQTIQPADIIILEGNFPFHIPEIARLIDLKIVYFAEDPIRLKRKWKRDVDFRKKYDPNYLVNRYFRTQSQRNQEIYQPMMQCCDIIVDTTNAQLWLHPNLQSQLHF
jgi:uridine kinase